MGNAAGGGKGRSAGDGDAGGGDERRAWRSVTSRRAGRIEPGDEPGERHPHVRSLYIYAWGQRGGVGACPDLRWDDSAHVKCEPAGRLLDYQARFAVDSVHMRHLPADTLDEVLDVYAKCPAAAVKRMHLEQCDTSGLDRTRVAVMFKAQHLRSSMEHVSDTSGALRTDHFRSLGVDGKAHRLFYLGEEVVYEQAAGAGEPNRRHSMAGSGGGYYAAGGVGGGSYGGYGTQRSSQYSQHAQQQQPYYGPPAVGTPTYEPQYNVLSVPRATSGALAPGQQQGPVYGEKANWRNVARGRQPPFRLYYAEIVAEVLAGGGLSCTEHPVSIVPDLAWGSGYAVRCAAAKASNYMQYVDMDTLAVVCRSRTRGTSATLAALLANLAVSQGSRSARSITFAGCDFGSVTGDRFADFLRAHSLNLDAVHFDAGCTSLQQVRMALTAVYADDESIGGGPINVNLPLAHNGHAPDAYNDYATYN